MDYFAIIETEGTALLRSTSTNLDAEVPSCPGWSSRRLLRHVARLLHGVGVAVPRGTTDPPPRNPPAPTEDAQLIAFGWQALTDVLAALRDTDPDLPAWNHTGAPAVAGFWSRRLAHELVVHRWDADTATGRTRLPAAAVAADGVDELLTVLLPGIARTRVPRDAASVHVHLTDTAPGGEWLVRWADGAFEVHREHARGDAALRGPAGPVLLALWGRVPFDHPDLAVLGDHGLLAELSTGL
ncbi:maleylpyruvate isomerase N-terminal domain-containing protein [Candidatus Frankia nodulisporulans]|uniref:maleylpyruvate isomerase N-terminal domain-containing protein n=1 Tax=Candidatus Frankia nodulisporulans TaxID=2060052 RepID=UPI0013D6DCDD|nr:maleylpyruvate isomerase N-terminal domain-containing protein [Candidatus Frankia nodulisporulans]